MQQTLIPLKEAIKAHVTSGSSVVMGACLEPDVPFAATHEIIRQNITDLNIIAPISDASSDMLIGAGCVSGITGAWVGNVSGGLGHNYRRAFEGDQPSNIKLRDHSNFSLGMALMAGAYGMPYAPMRSILGSDILKSNSDFKVENNPFTQGHDPVVLVPPLKPDVAILPVQRADKNGSCHHWGSRGLVHEAAFASEKVILLADEIVEEEVILSDPSRVLIPGHLVTAVCHVPAAVHPSPMTGKWRRDHDFFADYHKRSRTPEGFRDWLEEWVIGTGSHEAYCKKLGSQLSDLKIKGSAPAAEANFARA